MKKILIGILMIGSLMFVGCDKQEIPEGTIIESTQEDELAIDVYGKDLVLGYTNIPLNEYMPKVSIKEIPLDRYNDILKLPEGSLDTEIAKSRAVDYLMGVTDKLPNELVKKEETVEEPKEQPKNNVKEYIDNKTNNNEEEVIEDQGDATPEKYPWLFDDDCCANCHSEEYDKNTGLCDDCLGEGDEFRYRLCEQCGQIYVMQSEPDPTYVWDGYCPNCEYYYSHKAPYNTQYIKCEQCGGNRFDWEKNKCLDCGYHW